MSSSGVIVNPECQQTFQRLSEGRKEFRYIIFAIQNNEVMVEVAVTAADIGLESDDHDENSRTAYEHFVDELKRRTDGLADCRYAVFDFKFKTSRVGAGETKTEKIVFLQLCPDGASVKKKMLYASSAAAIKQSLGTAKILQFQISDESEMAHKELLGKLIEKYSDH